MSIAEIWRQFLRTRQEEIRGNISYSSFRNIFRTFKLSFRKPYVDTCGSCDSLSIKAKYSEDETEKENAPQLKSLHVQKADQHYDCISYDLDILPREKNNPKELGWVLPPVWKSQK